MPERLPEIAYDEHPVFAGDSSRVGWGGRLLALLRVVEFSAYVLAVRSMQAMRRTPVTVAGDKNVERLKQDGFFVARFSADDRQALLTAAAPYFDRLAEARRHIPAGQRGYHETQLDTSSRDAPELFEAMRRALANAGILTSVHGYLACKAELRKITLQINDEQDNFWRARFDARGVAVPNTAFFHFDNTYSVVKAMVYVSDVGAANGPFSYVPGTHRLRIGFFEALILRATDIWLDNHGHEWPLFLTLPRFLRKRAKFGEDIPAGEDWGQWLVDNERVLTSRDGDAIIFDVKGIHRGAMVQSGERRAIQVMMS